ncbi:MAG: hypothetical protein K6A65_00295, partial [Succinivibrionaceae bacterium]|nr:hypothetical protein [Succinivibrionaceae bacterium]
MSVGERELLLSPALSHEARSLYLLFLRPLAERGRIPPDLGPMAGYLSSESPNFPLEAGYDTARAVLGELVAAGLARVTGEGEARHVELTIFERERSALPAEAFAMFQDWRPGPTFADAARAGGLADARFRDQELGGFVRFWLGKRERRTQYAWECTFVERLKRARSAREGVGYRSRAQAAR